MRGGADAEVLECNENWLCCQTELGFNPLNLIYWLRDIGQVTSVSSSYKVAGADLTLSRRLTTLADLP